jgi:ATP-dependent RNA helicase DeaD
MVEKMLKRKFTKVLVPTGDEVCQQKIVGLVHKVRHVEVNEEEIDSFLPEVYHELKDLSKEDIIKRFASIEFNRFLEYYRDARDLNKSEKRSYVDEGGSDGAYSSGDRVFINVGKMDGLEAGTLLGLICDYGSVSRDKVGKIDLKGAYSFFEIGKEFTNQVMKGFEGVELRGRKVRLEMTGGRRPEKSGGDRPDRGGRDGGRKRNFSDKKREGSWGGGGSKGRKRY